MTKSDVINNLLSTYSKYGFAWEDIEEVIANGEKEGFSYRTIYNGIRMALARITGEHELFTVSDIAEAIGATEEEVINQVEKMRAELIEKGENPDEYFPEVKPLDIQSFVIPPEKYTS